jgi:hypothetical protein
MSNVGARWQRQTGLVGTAASLKVRGAGVDVASVLQQAGPGGSEEADGWDPAGRTFSGLKHF